MISIHRASKILIRLELFLPLVAILAMGWLSYRTNAEFKAAVAGVIHTHSVLNTIEQTHVHLVGAESGQRGYVLTGRESYLEPYTAALASINGDLQKLKELTSQKPVQQQNIVKLQSLIDKRLSLESQTIDLRRTNSAAALALVLTDEGENTMEKIRDVLSEMRMYEDGLLVERENHIQTKSVLTNVILLTFIGLGAIVLLIMAATLHRLEKLERFVTVCAWTGQVKYEGQWIRPDEYLQRRFGLSVSHGLSKDATEKIMAEIEEHGRKEDGAKERCLNPRQKP